MFRCLQQHDHQSDLEREDCDSRTHDALSLVKMAQVGFTGPAKIPRLYEPGRATMRAGLEVVVFSEEQVVPWGLEHDEEE